MGGGAYSSVTMYLLDASAILTESKEAAKPRSLEAGQVGSVHCLQAAAAYSKCCQNNPNTVWAPLVYRKSASEGVLGIVIPRFFSDDLVSVMARG